MKIPKFWIKQNYGSGCPGSFFAFLFLSFSSALRKNWVVSWIFPKKWIVKRLRVMSSQPFFFSEFLPRKQEELHCQPCFYGYIASKNNLKILILENPSFWFERTQFNNVVSACDIFNLRAGVISKNSFLLVSGILGLKPAPNDGTPGSLLHLLDPEGINVDVLESKSDGNLMRNDICRYPTSLVDCKECVCPWCMVSKLVRYSL